MPEVRDVYKMLAEKYGIELPDDADLEEKRRAIESRVSEKELARSLSRGASKFGSFGGKAPESTFEPSFTRVKSELGAVAREQDARQALKDMIAKKYMGMEEQSYRDQAKIDEEKRKNEAWKERFNFQESAREKARSETRNAEKQDRAVSPADVRQFSDGKDAFRAVGLLNQTMKEVESVIGPGKGGLRGLNPWDAKAQKVNADLRRSAQVVGKFLEGGVLRKEDEAKYLLMLPAIGDMPEVARYKLDNMLKMLRGKYDDMMTALKAQGYRTEGLEIDDAAMYRAAQQSVPVAPTSAPADVPAAGTLTPEEQAELQRLKAKFGK